MRNILYLKYIHALLLYFDGACPSAATIERLAGGIGHRYIINKQVIVMESWNLRLGGNGPCTIIAFGHIIFGSAQIYLHVLCLRGLNTEHHAVISQNTGIRVTVDIGNR